VFLVARPWKTFAVINVRGAKEPFPKGLGCYAQNQKGKKRQNDCALDKFHFHLISPPLLWLSPTPPCGGENRGRFGWGPPSLVRANQGKKST
jgi:hypothetical protein